MKHHFLSLRWKIIVIYASVLIIGVAIAGGVIQDRYQTIFVEEQLNELTVQQEAILANLSFYIDQKIFQPVNDVQTIIIRTDKTVLAQSCFPEQRLFNELMQIAVSQQNERLQYHYEIGEQLMNVQITKVVAAESLFVISYVLTGVPSFLSNVLMKEVIILFGVLFIAGSGLFLFWTLFIARDLRKINNFAKEIGERNWQAKLSVSRQDEIGELGDQLQRVQQQLANNEWQQQCFYHHTSHDLKTPIAVIQGYAEAMIEGIYPQGDEIASAQIIAEEAQLLNRKVEQLLRYAKMQQPNLQARTSCNLVELGEQLQRKWQPISDIEIQFTVKTTKCEWYGSSWEWEQVLQNLLENALRYANRKIVISLLDDEITIYNDGSPISDVILAHVFEPFVIGESGKYGLGLAICAEFAKNYEYEFQAENLAGGVIFSLKRNNES